MKGRIPEMEYVFCDTGEELRETKGYIDKLEAYLGQKIHRLNPERPFTHYLEVYRGVLPDARTRWCTRMLKIRPFERYVGDDPVISYVGIRADELHRKGYISSKANITVKYPFIDDNIRIDGVHRIIEESGLGLPDYYRWRSRSGCYFCFFQQRHEWASLLETHPDLFWKAASFEKSDPETGERFTWVENESLKELSSPARLAEIKAEYVKRRAKLAASLSKDASLQQVFGDDLGPGSACLVCHL
jgi:3'-phosphoadenosine 5'-phosphosulfate sulfotransferase (PAPS reductase)/FAD synthetase